MSQRRPGWTKEKTLPKTIKQPSDSDIVSAFFTCPRGHPLPHRVKGKGRCAPFDCCLSKDGAHGVVRKEARADNLEASAYALETQRIVEAKARMRAWNDAHPVPELPPPPKTGSVQEYMQKRLEQSAPLMLEMRIRRALLDPDHTGAEAAKELLDRAGFTTRPDGKVNIEGPVLILNFDPKRDSPYEAQKHIEAASRPEYAEFTESNTEGEGVREGVSGSGQDDEA